MGEIESEFLGRSVSGAPNSPEHVLRMARGLGVVLWVERGKLLYRAPSGVMNPDLVADLKRARPVVIDLLGAEAAARNGSIPNFRRAAQPRGKVVSFRRSSWSALRAGLTEVDSTNIHLAVKFRVQASHLKHALDKIFARHTILSCMLADDDGCPVFVGRDHAGIHIKSIIDAVEGHGSVDNFVHEFVWRKFQLDIDNISRAVVLDIGGGESICVVVAHHMAFDAASRNILLDEIVSSINIDVDALGDVGRESISYEDYLFCMAEWMESARSEAASRFWLERLRGVSSPFALRSQADESAHMPFLIGEAACEGIRSLARKSRVTNFAVLLAIQVLTVALRGGFYDVTILSINSGREDPRLYRTIGYLADRVFYRIKLNQCATFLDLLRETWCSIGESDKNSYLRYDKISEMMAADGRSIHVPSINYSEDHDHVSSPTSRDGAWLEEYPVKPSEFLTRPWVGMSGFQLKMRRMGGVIGGTIRYAQGYGVSNSYFLADFFYILKQVLENGDVSLSDISTSSKFDGHLFEAGVGVES